MNRENIIFVTGHTGLVGSSVLELLKAEGFKNILVRTRQELDLIRQDDVHRFFKENKIDTVIHAAANVGGIQANLKYPVDYIYDNLVMTTNVLHAAAENNVTKLLFMSSSAVFPKHTPQPMREESMLSGPLEPTNEAFAVAKIAGIKLCESYRRQFGKVFISVVSSNLYGPRDNFDLERSHVIPAMMRRFHEAKKSNVSEVVIWGTGMPRRDFLFIDDHSRALLTILEKYNHSEPINIGSGFDCSIMELAQVMKEVVGYSGKIVYDAQKPDGMPRKILDIRKLELMDWRPLISLKDGLTKMYQWAISKNIL